MRSAGALADAYGVAHAVDVVAEEFLALGEQLAVGHQTGADVDDVDVVYDLLGAGYSLEVLALGYDGACDAGLVFVGDGAHQRVARHYGYAETAHTVGLHGEAAFAGHGLDDSLYGGSGLHALI